MSDTEADFDNSAEEVNIEVKNVIVAIRIHSMPKGRMVRRYSPIIINWR